MKREFVSYEQAESLKELGFDEMCFSFFDTDGELYESEGTYKRNENVWEHETIAPLKQQAFKFFRDKYDAHMHPDKLMPGVYIIRYGDWTSITYNTYEEAESACIDKLIELAKQDNDKN